MGKLHICRPDAFSSVLGFHHLNGNSRLRSKEVVECQLCFHPSVLLTNPCNLDKTQQGHWLWLDGGGRRGDQRANVAKISGENHFGRFQLRRWTDLSVIRGRLKGSKEPRSTADKIRKPPLQTFFLSAQKNVHFHSLWNLEYKRFLTPSFMFDWN